MKTKVSGMKNRRLVGIMSIALVSLNSSMKCPSRSPFMSVVNDLERREHPWFALQPTHSVVYCSLRI